MDVLTEIDNARTPIATFRIVFGNKNNNYLAPSSIHVVQHTLHIYLDRPLKRVFVFFTLMANMFTTRATPSVIYPLSFLIIVLVRVHVRYMYRHAGNVQKIYESMYIFVQFSIYRLVTYLVLDIGADLEVRHGGEGDFRVRAKKGVYYYF